MAVSAAIAGLTPACTAQVSDRPFRAIGAFSSGRFTGEHAYGYSVELWRAGDSVIGLLLASAGLDGDAPIGILEDVQFDSHSGSLSFRAKLTMGAALVAGGSQQPSQDLFEFSGVLRAKRLAAILTHCDPRRAESGERAMVRLTLQPKRDMLQAASYSEWKVLVEPILQARDRSGSHRRHGISYRRS